MDELTRSGFGKEIISYPVRHLVAVKGPEDPTSFLANVVEKDNVQWTIDPETVMTIVYFIHFLD